MQGSDIDTFASGLPTNFRLLRDFTLDTRGNRTFVDSYNASLGLVVSDDYDPNDDNNLYDEINGLSYNFDDNQNETYDPTGVHTAAGRWCSRLRYRGHAGGCRRYAVEPPQAALPRFAPGEAKRSRGKKGSLNPEPRSGGSCAGRRVAASRLTSLLLLIPRLHFIPPGANQ